MVPITRRSSREGGTPGNETIPEVTERTAETNTQGTETLIDTAMPQPDKSELRQRRAKAIRFQDNSVSEATTSSDIWFPYLLEPDKTVSFRFSTEPNKQFNKAQTSDTGRFNPNVTPTEDWGSFANQVWKYLEPYMIDGISPEQYSIMLKHHFDPKVWDRIYENQMRGKTLTERAEFCDGVLHLYTLNCYSMEARVRDYNKYISSEDLTMITDSIYIFHQAHQLITADEKDVIYYHLLNLVRHWTPTERDTFFSVEKCLNSFSAPDMNKITPEVLKEAIAQSSQYGQKRKSLRLHVPDRKRSSIDDDGDGLANKRTRKSDSNQASQTRRGAGPHVTCDTAKYTRTFEHLSKWLKSGPIREKINDLWRNTGPKRTFQPFLLPLKNYNVSISREERRYRARNRLCRRCGNHDKDDGAQCTLHPLYDDVKADNDSILGRDRREWVQSTSLSPLRIHSTIGELSEENSEETDESPLDDSQEYYYPGWMRDQVERAAELSPSELSDSAEVLTRQGNWKKVPITIDTHSQRCFVSRSFIERHNLDNLVRPPRNNIHVKAHLHESIIIRDKALWVRLKMDEDSTPMNTF